jgi:hypothetical protein
MENEFLNKLEYQRDINMNDLNSQISTYQKNLQSFLDSIEDGNLDEQVRYIKQNYDYLNNDERQKINDQITSFVPEREGIPNKIEETQKRKRQVDKILKSITQSITGALGLPDNLRDAGNRFVSNARNELKRNLANPGVLLSRILNPRRRTSNQIIKPEDFYSSNNKIVEKEDNIQDYLALDNNRNHLIVFHITNSDDILVFRMANFSGLTDSFTVTKSTQRYFGRSEDFYLYQSVSRDISFSFDVVINSENDLDVIYSKLNTLVSLCYPHRYTDNKMIEPNILRLSIGEYLTRKPFFISSLTYTADTDLVFFEGKPSAMTVTINGNLLQSEQNPKYETTNITRYINNNKSSRLSNDIEKVSIPQNIKLPEIRRVSGASSISNARFRNLDASGGILG